MPWGGVGDRCHGVCGGDLVPWGVWRRPGAMGGCRRPVPWGVWRRPGAKRVCGDLVPWGIGDLVPPHTP